jgi:hypothetical protein
MGALYVFTVFFIPDADNSALSACFAQIAPDGHLDVNDQAP